MFYIIVAHRSWSVRWRDSLHSGLQPPGLLHVWALKTALTCSPGMSQWSWPGSWNAYFNGWMFLSQWCRECLCPRACTVSFADAAVWWCRQKPILVGLTFKASIFHLWRNGHVPSQGRSENGSLLNSIMDVSIVSWIVFIALSVSYSITTNTWHCVRKDIA